MTKGEDAIRKKKNKANRKKMQKDTSTVSARIASIIAAKKRRKSGKRSNCQGMCFSLPSLEDPFNDRYGRLDTKRKETKNVPPRKGTPGGNHANIEPREHKMLRDKNLVSEQTISRTSVDNVGQKSIVKPTKPKIQLMEKSEAVHAQQGQGFNNSGCPSKFLILCLNSIQNALRHDGTLSSEDDKPLFVDTWGVEFWRCYSSGKDILETSGACSTIEQISWIASTAADTIARKEKEGQSFTNPFLLFLVPSQEKATKVRLVCKSLKSLGIHTVSLHSGAALDHQIHGLKSCEPEFIVSTTERLLELVSLKAIDISGVSLLVVDGLGTFSISGCLDSIKSIRQAISGNPQCVVFNDGLNYEYVPLLQNLLQGSICRLSLDDSITSQSDCIIQSVHVCVSEEEKISKGIQILDQACGNQLGPQLSKVLFIVGKGSSSHKLVTAIKLKGYSVSTKPIWSKSEVQISSKMRSAVFVVNVEQISTADLGEFEVVIISDFVLSIDSYLQILTRMARYSVNGMLHSFLTREEARLAGPLVEILEKCRQTVPESLKNLCNVASPILEN